MGQRRASERQVRHVQPAGAQLFSSVTFANFFATTLSCLLRNGTAQDSFQKLQLILQLCQELGIHTTPARLGNLCIVPLLSWHHSSWDKEPDIQGVPHVSALSIADYGACIWPDTGPGTSVSLMLFMSRCDFCSVPGWQLEGCFCHTFLMAVCTSHTWILVTALFCISFETLYVTCCSMTGRARHASWPSAAALGIKALAGFKRAVQSRQQRTKHFLQTVLSECEVLHCCRTGGTRVS